MHVVNQMYFPLSARRPASLELYATQAAGADFPAKYQLPNKSKVNTEIWICLKSTRGLIEKIWNFATDQL